MEHYGHTGETLRRRRVARKLSRELSKWQRAARAAEAAQAAAADGVFVDGGANIFINQARREIARALKDAPDLPDDPTSGGRGNGGGDSLARAAGWSRRKRSPGGHPCKLSKARKPKQVARIFPEPGSIREQRALAARRARSEQAAAAEAAQEEANLREARQEEQQQQKMKRKGFFFCCG